MSISNYPKVLKYAVGDRAYVLRSFSSDHDFGAVTVLNGNGRSDGISMRVKITGWKTVVTDSYGDGTGTPIQTDYYTVREIIGYSSENVLIAVELYSTTEFEVSANKLYSSKNHLLSIIKGKYLNSAFGNLHDDGYLYFSNMGANIDSEGYVQITSNGDWIDWAGMNFKNMNFTEFFFNATWLGGFVGAEPAGTKTLVTDNCNLEGAILPENYNTRALLINNIFSYDAETTIYSDGYPLGRPVSGTAAGTSGGTTVTGTGTKFATELEIGDKIKLHNIATIYTVVSIASDTSMTLNSTFSITFATRTISRVFEP